MAGESYKPLTAQQQCNIICCKKTIQFEGQAPVRQFSVLRVKRHRLLLCVSGATIWLSIAAQIPDLIFTKFTMSVHYKFSLRSCSEKNKNVDKRRTHQLTLTAFFLVILKIPSKIPTRLG